jgi:hypothetical protein
MREEIKDLKIHAYLGVTIVYGRKPGGKRRDEEKLPQPATSSGFVSPDGSGVGWSPLPVDYQGLP